MKIVLLILWLKMKDNDFVVEVKDLTKKFGHFTAVNRVSFNVHKGEIFGFLGANGAGKTTTIKILSGLLTPTSGTAKVAGYDVYTSAESIKNRIGYMSQKFSLYDDLTIEENITLFGGIYGLDDEKIKQKKDFLIKKLELEEVKNKLLRDLPLGWKQKLAFSVAILHDPEIVFLDEPTGGVDPIMRRQFWELIYEAASQGVTVFVTTHYMDEAEYCNRVIMMSDGKIEAIGTPGNLKEEFGVDTMNDVFIKIERG